jgi:hypothetical protein
MLHEAWSPEHNYVSLGQHSLILDRLAILDEYVKIVEEEISNSKDLYKNLIVLVGLVDSDYRKVN